MKKTYCDYQTNFVEFYSAVRDELSYEQKGVLLDLLVEKEDKVITQNISDKAVLISYRFIKNGLKKAEKRYKDKCQSNRQNAVKRWEREKNSKEHHAE